MPQLQFHYCLFHPRAPLFSFIKFLVQRSSQTHRVCPNVYPNSNRANFFFFLTPSHLSSEVFGFQRLKSHWDTHTHTRTQHCHHYRQVIFKPSLRSRAVFHHNIQRYFSRILPFKSTIRPRGGNFARRQSKLVFHMCCAALD